MFQIILFYGRLHQQSKNCIYDKLLTAKRLEVLKTQNRLPLQSGIPFKNCFLDLEEAISTDDKLMCHKHIQMAVLQSHGCNCHLTLLPSLHMPLDDTIEHDHIWARRGKKQTDSKYLIFNRLRLDLRECFHLSFFTQ